MAGAVAVAIGGGPSLTQAQVDYCHGKARTIAINDAYRAAPWADLLYFCDERWYRWHEQDVQSFQGMKVTLENRHLTAEIQGLVCMRHDGQEGLCLSPDGLRTGRNSGYQAINLAAHLGVKKLILLGYDMTAPAAGPQHWFGDHPLAGFRGRFAQFSQHFNSLIEPLRAIGLQVLNCTPGSALDAFPMASLEEALA